MRGISTIIFRTMTKFPENERNYRNKIVKSDSKNKFQVFDRILKLPIKYLKNLKLITNCEENSLDPLKL